MTKPTTYRKLVLGAALLLSFALWGAERGEAELEWKLFGKYEGVEVYYSVSYMPYQCNVSWRFRNTNSYAVAVDISKKYYTSNYGKSFFVEKSYQSYHNNVRGGETKSTLGDHITYEDPGWSNGERWPVVSVKNITYLVAPAK
jgi:hypothetical protein